MSLENSYAHLSDYLFMNFLNTVNNKTEEMTDLIVDEESTIAWLHFMEEKGMLSSRQIEIIKRDSIKAEDLQAFRDLIRSYFIESHAEGDLVDVLEHKTEKVPLHFTVSSDSIVPLPFKGGTDGIISLLSYMIFDSYRAGLFSKIKKCEHPSCVALFIDEKGKRKWCSMRVCGNRAKAQKYYTKKKG